MATKQIPGTTVELLDRRIASSTQLESPIGLVIGRSYSGPTGSVIVLDDDASAAKVYGANSPLLKYAAAARSTGIKTVLLYRVGGSSAVLSGFAGEGSTLTTLEESASAGDKLRVYQGPSQNDPTVNVLIVFYGLIGNKVVYSNVPGSEVDLGYVKVEGFSGPDALQIGTFDAPVLLSAVADSFATSSTQAATLSGGNKYTQLTGTPSLFGSITSVTKNGNAVTGEYLVFVDGVKKVDTSTSTQALQAVPSTGIYFYDVNGVDGDALVVNYKINSAVISYDNGKNSLSATKNELYELVDDALRQNETSVAEYLFVEGATLDAPNIADGSTDSDRLQYLHLEEEDGEYTYTWSDTKVSYKKGAGSTTNIAQADRDSHGQPIVLKSFSEVNFAHRIGVHCYNVSQNDSFILATVETTLPKTASLKDISTHIGTEPVVDKETGLIVVNGTGLLGNKFMAGSTNQVKGFFLTDNGLVDGEILNDSGGAPIDLGKFLNIVPVANGTANSYRSAAADYLGVIASTVPGDSTTNRLVGSVTLAYQIKKPALKALMNAGYVVFVNKTDGVRVLSGELATSEYSDYQYVSTSLIIQNIVKRIRKVTDAYIGKGFKVAQVAALRTAIDTVLRDAGQENLIEGSAYDVVIVGPGAVIVPLQLNVTDELRTVAVTISLTTETL